jgi:hypothetical protein
MCLRLDSRCADTTGGWHDQLSVLTCHWTLGFASGQCSSDLECRVRWLSPLGRSVIASGLQPLDCECPFRSWAPWADLGSRPKAFTLPAAPSADLTSSPMVVGVRHDQLSVLTCHLTIGFQVASALQTLNVGSDGFRPLGARSLRVAFSHSTVMPFQLFGPLGRPWVASQGTHLSSDSVRWLSSVGPFDSSPCSATVPIASHGDRALAAWRQNHTKSAGVRSRTGCGRNFL